MIGLPVSAVLEHLHLPIPCHPVAYQYYDERDMAPQHLIIPLIMIGLLTSSLPSANFRMRHRSTSN